MKVLITLTLAVVITFICVAYAKRNGKQGSIAKQLSACESPISWPALPECDFIAGRVATREDVVAGRAGFVAEKDGREIGTPLMIKIPQYAYHIDAANGCRTPGVIIQAEKANGLEILVLRLNDGTDIVGLANEFQLLGITSPQQ